MQRPHSEHAEQVSFFRFLATLKRDEPAYAGLVCFAIPNGGSRDPVTGARLRDEGVTKGIPDIFCAYPVAPYHGLFIEMKTDVGRVSKFQAIQMALLKRAGYACVVCRGFQSARETLLTYLNGEYKDEV